MINVRLSNNHSNIYGKTTNLVYFNQDKAAKIKESQLKKEKQEHNKESKEQKRTLARLFLVGLVSLAGILLYKKHKNSKQAEKELTNFEKKYGEKAKENLNNIVKNYSSKEKLQIIRKTKENLDRKLDHKKLDNTSKQNLAAKIITRNEEKIKRQAEYRSSTIDDIDDDFFIALDTDDSASLLDIFD